MDIRRGNPAGYRETVLIDQSAEFSAFYLLLAVEADISPLFVGIAFVSVIP